MDAEALIEHNIRAHDRVASTYAAKHGEIYNSMEQARLREALGRAMSAVRSGGVRALDFGCGSGNLTEHLQALGADVVAADVSEGFLRQMAARGVTTARLNGRDLSEFPDGSFDLVATYSVLHHVPDYLGAVREMARVLKPGGVLYIDHEAAPSAWSPSPDLQAYRLAMNPPRSFARRLTNLLNPGWYVVRLKLLKDPRYQPEGDIHVWPDDHIEWGRVEAEAGVDVVERTEYLLSRRECPPALYAQYVDRCVDMRVLIGRKGEKRPG